jgi:hypothetical protein
VIIQIGEADEPLPTVAEPSTRGCGEGELDSYAAKLSGLSDAVNCDLGGVRTYSQLCHFLVCPNILHQTASYLTLSGLEEGEIE